MKKILIACIVILLMISNINAQQDTAKSKRKIYLGFNFTSLKVFYKPPANSYFNERDDFNFKHKLSNVEFEIYSRFYLYKKIYLKPSVGFKILNYFFKNSINIYNGPNSVFSASLIMKEKVDKFFFYIPIGFGVPKKRFSLFSEAGLGLIPILNLKNQLIDYNEVAQMNYWSQQSANFIPGSLRFSKDYGRVFFKTSAGISLKFLKSFVFNSSFSIEGSNYRSKLKENNIKWKYRYWGISFGLMYNLR